MSSYVEYLRTGYPDLFALTANAPSGSHWLRSLLVYPHHSRLDSTVLPQLLGASLLEVVNGNLKIKWSNRYLDDGSKLDIIPLDSAAISTTADTLIKKIDEPTTMVDNLQIVVIHCGTTMGGPPGCNHSSIQSSSTLEALIDIIGLRFGINPRFFTHHFKKAMSEHLNNPGCYALPSETNFVQLTHPNGGYVTASSGLGNMDNSSIAIVLDSTLPTAKGRQLYTFMPKYHSSFMDATFLCLRHRVDEIDDLYHLKPYAKHILRSALVAINNTHSCTDAMCLAVARTWQEIRTNTEILNENLTSLQQFIDARKQQAPTQDVSSTLLSDGFCQINEASIGAQAQIQTSSTAMEEAQESYKLSKSVERLTTIAWIFIPLSFSASFFGMNVSQLTEGPNIGYFFLLVIISLFISAFSGIFFTEWWHRKALLWRDLVQPGHSCAPRQPISLASLILLTVRWIGRTFLSFFTTPFRRKKSSVSV